MDRCVIECLENMRCLKSDSDSESKDANENKIPKKERQKKDLKSLLWEIIFYAVFLVLLVCTAFENRDQRSYGFHSSILAAADPEGQISKISTPLEMLDWTQTRLLPFLYGTLDWDNFILVDRWRVTASLASFRLGPTRIRQHRARPRSCEAPSRIRSFSLRCIPGWSSRYHDWDDYGPGWTAVETDISDSNPGVRSPWRYSRWADVGGTPVAGLHGVYPYGGYVKDLYGTLEDVTEELNRLQNLQWIDQWTKVVFIETTIYTPNINMFAMVTALFEFPQAMAIQAQFYTHPFKLLAYQTDYPTSARLFNFLLYFVIVWFVLRLLFKLCRWRWSFFRKFWNVLELADMFLALAVVVFYVGRQIVSEYVAKEAAKATGQFYNFQTLAMWDQLFGILLGFCCCLSTLKVLHLLRFNRRMSLLGATMRRSAGDLIGFSFMYGLIMAAFISFSYQVYSGLVYSYSTIMGTIQSLLLLGLGDLKYEQISSGNRVFAPVLITVYMSIIIFILLNVLVTILMDSFAIARDVIKEQANDFELLDYIAESFKYMVTAPFQRCISSPVTLKNPDRSPGSRAKTISHARDSLLCKKQFGCSRYRNKPSYPRTVRFSLNSTAESPRKPARHFTPKASKYLKNKLLQKNTVGASKVLKKCLLNGRASTINTAEENTRMLLHQLDVIDQRFDRLWQLFAANECGPPPELDTIYRWREVKVTVADVISEHLGYNDDSDNAVDNRSFASIETDESYVEMSIARLRLLVQMERRNMLNLESPSVSNDDHLRFGTSNDDQHLDFIDGQNQKRARTAKGFRDTDVEPCEKGENTNFNFTTDETAADFCEEIVTLNQDDLFSDNDMYISEEEDSRVLDHTGEAVMSDMTGKETQNQVVPSLNPERVKQMFRDNAREDIDMRFNVEDKAKQIDIETPVSLEEDEPGKSQMLTDGLCDRPLDLKNVQETTKSFDYDKSNESEPKFQLVDETNTCLKPFSLSAAENDWQIKRANKKRVEEKMNVHEEKSLTPMEKLNMHYRKGIRFPSWPEASLGDLDNVAIVNFSSPEPKPGIASNFSHVFNDTGYNSSIDLGKDADDFSPKNQVVPSLTMTQAAQSDPEQNLEDDTTF